MRKILLSVISLFAIVATSLAEGIHIGYVDGVIAPDTDGNTVTGIVGTNATIQEAIFITPAMLKNYASCQITSVYVGLAEGGAVYPDNVTAWVRADKDGDNIASGTAVAEAGWTAVKLTSAINVKDYVETGVWVGFSFVQSKKTNIIAFLKEAAADNTGWICKNGKWTNYSTKGALPIEAIIEGDGLPQHDLSLISARLNPEIIQIGAPVKVKATIKNNALVEAANPVINYSILDGKVKGSTKIPVTLKYREKATVEFEVDASIVTDECQGIMTLDLAWGDGSVDEIADNNATLDITFAKDVYYKNLLVEEATGAWCGFCVRGIVGLREMTKKYPERFIGIAVHNGDDYVVKDYDAWIGSYISGYPSCLANRNGVLDPSFEELEDYYDNMEIVSKLCVEPTAVINDGTINFSSNIKFAKNEQGGNYSIAYVLIENQLPIYQSNYYSGNSYGPMGGFESMESHCNIIVDEIARGIFPSPAGETLDLPATIVKGESYEHALTTEAPVYSDLANCSIAAFVIDNATGEIVNSGRGTIITSTGVNIIETASADNAATYNLAGQRVVNTQKGIYIHNGKKYIK